MILPPDRLPPPILVEDAAGLRELLEELRGHAEIAVDTEADSFFHYREQVCLIQITAGDQDWLVDPLREFDVGALGEMLEDPARRKVFHDGEYDVLLLKRQYGWSIRNLFDTRVAAAALGARSPGLAAVVEEEFGIELDKSLQRSDWSRRPLSPKQIAYARLDTRYLLPLKERLEERLGQRGRLAVLESECLRLEALEPPEREFDPDEFIRLKGARALDKRQMSVLRELFALRDELARERDVPAFKVLGNHTLLDLARSDVRRRGQLAEVKGLTPRNLRVLADGLLEAMERGRAAGPLQRVPRLKDKDGTGGMSEEEAELHDRLKAWRKRVADEEDMDSSLVLNRLVLVRLAKEQPKDRSSLQAIEGLAPWQVDAYAQSLLGIVKQFEADRAAGLVPKRRRGSRR